MGKVKKPEDVLHECKYATEIIEKLKANDWEEREGYLVNKEHIVLFLYDKDAALETLPFLPEYETAEFFRLLKAPYKEWKHVKNIPYDMKYGLHPSWIIKIIRILYGGFSATVIGKTVLGFLPTTKPIIMHIPYKDDYAVFIIAPLLMEEGLEETEIYGERYELDFGLGDKPTYYDLERQVIGFYVEGKIRSIEEYHKLVEAKIREKEEREKRIEEEKEREEARRAIFEVETWKLVYVPATGDYDWDYEIRGYTAVRTFHSFSDAIIFIKKGKSRIYIPHLEALGDATWEVVEITPFKLKVDEEIETPEEIYTLLKPTFELDKKAWIWEVLAEDKTTHETSYKYIPEDELIKLKEKVKEKKVREHEFGIEVYRAGTWHLTHSPGLGYKTYDEAEKRAIELSEKTGERHRVVEYDYEELARYDVKSYPAVKVPEKVKLSREEQEERCMLFHITKGWLPDEIVGPCKLDVKEVNRYYEYLTAKLPERERTYDDIRKLAGKILIEKFNESKEVVDELLSEVRVVPEKVKIHGVLASRYRCPICYRAAPDNFCTVHGDVKSIDLSTADETAKEAVIDLTLLDLFKNKQPEKKRWTIDELHDAVGIDTAYAPEFLTKLRPPETYAEYYDREFGVKIEGVEIAPPPKKFEEAVAEKKKDIEKRIEEHERIREIKETIDLFIHRHRDMRNPEEFLAYAEDVLTLTAELPEPERQFYEKKLGGMITLAKSLLAAPKKQIIKPEEVDLIKKDYSRFIAEGNYPVAAFLDYVMTHRGERMSGEVAEVLEALEEAGYDKEKIGMIRGWFT